jgi:hypothetical protein
MDRTARVMNSMPWLVLFAIVAWLGYQGVVVAQNLNLRLNSAIAHAGR